MPWGPCSHSVPGGVQARPVMGTQQTPKPQLDLKISQLPSNLGIDRSFIHSTKMLSPVPRCWGSEMDRERPALHKPQPMGRHIREQAKTFSRVSGIILFTTAPLIPGTRPSTQ